tara:strand:- start:3162 stop:3404 length:243 start_codon:yes stop_codon:yes gene_type:complete
MITLAQAFEKAINQKSNRNEDGSVNWNYVDADCAKDVNLHGASYHSVESTSFTMEACEAYYDYFDALCGKWEAQQRELSA